MPPGSEIPIQKKWSTFNKSRAYGESNNLGVYELGGRFNQVLYIGEGRIREQLLSHFSNGSAPCPGTAGYRVEYTKSKARAVQKQNALLAEYEARYGRLPKYNQKRRG